MDSSFNFPTPYLIVNISFVLVNNYFFLVRLFIVLDKVKFNILIHTEVFCSMGQRTLRQVNQIYFHASKLLVADLDMSTAFIMT